MITSVDSLPNLALITSTPGVTVALFHAKWSGPSREAISMIELVSHRFRSEIRFVLIDVDTATVVAKTLLVRAFPTMIIFNGMNEVKRFVCMPKALEDEIRKCLPILS